MLDGGAVAVSEEDDVTGNRAVRQAEDRIRELERQLGGETLEVEIPEEALDETRSKETDAACAVAAGGRFPVTVVAGTSGASRSDLHARMTGSAKPRRRCLEAQDAAGLPPIAALAAARPTCGHGRITAISGAASIGRRAPRPSAIRASTASCRRTTSGRPADAPSGRSRPAREEW
jgi:hypothetical protein